MWHFLFAKRFTQTHPLCWKHHSSSTTNHSTRGSLRLIHCTGNTTPVPPQITVPEVHSDSSTVLETPLQFHLKSQYQEFTQTHPLCWKHHSSSTTNHSTRSSLRLIHCAGNTTPVPPQITVPGVHSDSSTVLETPLQFHHKSQYQEFTQTHPLCWKHHSSSTTNHSTRGSLRLLHCAGNTTPVPPQITVPEVHSDSSTVLEIPLQFHHKSQYQRFTQTHPLCWKHHSSSTTNHSTRGSLRLIHCAGNTTPVPPQITVPEVHSDSSTVLETPFQFHHKSQYQRFTQTHPLCWIHHSSSTSNHSTRGSPRLLHCAGNTTQVPLQIKAYCKQHHNYSSNRIIDLVLQN